MKKEKYIRSSENDAISQTDHMCAKQKYNTNI